METDKKSGKRKGSRFERARMARLAAVQAIFQLNYLHAKPESVIKEFLDYRIPDLEYPYPVDRPLFLQIMQEVQARQTELQEHLSHCLKEGWTLSRIDPVLLAILTAGIAELLLKEPAASAPVIISEYIDITKGFFQGQEPAYVNKMLDQLAQQYGLALKKD